MAASMESKRRAARVVASLRGEYPEADCALRHVDAFQLLIATILSAQCTDERVNQVTPGLFAQYPTPADLAACPLPALEKAIQSTGFFRNKARNIQACCRQLVERHGGHIPRDLDALVQLPGVGRKTANVVLGTAFGLPTGVVVDTHVTRLAGRMGLTRETDAVKIEQDLIKILPRDEWIAFSHRMIHHGRRICNARKPNCDECVLSDACPRVGVVPAAPSAKSTRTAAKPIPSSSPKSKKPKKTKQRTSLATADSPEQPRQPVSQRAPGRKVSRRSSPA